MKTIKVTDELWEKIMLLKLKNKEKSINNLLESLLKEKKGCKSGKSSKK
jgi:predicted CopG family antitoxin